MEPMEIVVKLAFLVVRMLIAPLILVWGLAALGVSASYWVAFAILLAFALVS